MTPVFGDLHPTSLQYRVLCFSPNFHIWCVPLCVCLSPEPENVLLFGRLPLALLCPALSSGGPTPLLGSDPRAERWLSA